MFRAVRIVATCLAIVGLGIGFSAASPASANIGNGSCDQGEFCLWGEDHYRGCFYDNDRSNKWLRHARWRNCAQFSVDQGANSIRNRGVFCNVKLWDLAGGGGGWRIMNRPAVGGWTEDRDLANNFWIGGHGSLEDDISGYEFCP